MPSDYDVANAWAIALDASATLAGYCQERFDKPMQVSLGMDFGSENLTERDAPYAIVIPLRSKGGFETDYDVPSVVISIGVVDKVRETFGVHGTRSRGYGSLNQLEDIISKVLDSTEFTPSTWDGENDQLGKHFFVRHILFECVIPRTIGI